MSTTKYDSMDLEVIKKNLMTCENEQQFAQSIYALASVYIAKYGDDSILWEVARTLWTTYPNYEEFEQKVVEQFKQLTS